MKQELQEVQQACLAALEQVDSVAALEAIEQKFFGRKAGALSLLMKGLKDVSPAERKELGQAANVVKKELEAALAQKRSLVERAALEQQLGAETIDITQPQLPPRKTGQLHPITQIQYEVEDLFTSMGYLVADGPELDSDFYNFEAVNIPKHHPARDMQDTFYIKGHPEWVMRTHTSTMQVRAMQKYGVPLRMLAPGRCFRNEATDARHEHTFYQLEGMVIDKKISFGDLKGVLDILAKHLYGEETQVRLRPKFYPFVEPGVNGEVTCFLCKGDGCRVCKQSGWLEIFGAGLIHPNVLRAGGVDPTEYQGFAFGVGLNRLVMLKYGIEDIREFQSGDMRFLKQF